MTVTHGVGPIAKRMVAWAALVIGMSLPIVAIAQTSRQPAGQPTGQPNPASSASGEYTIGNEDVLQITVWGHPELERTVSVNAQGNVIVPPIGEIHAAGLTVRQLGDRLGDRLSTYLRQGATTVTVTVRDFISRSVYVSGAVARPGRYGAEDVPQLVDALNMAGGALPNGDLNRVTILKRAGPGPRQITADVGTAMKNGTVESLPTLSAGDMIVVPTAVSLVGVGQEQGVGVLGEVVRPGLYPVSPNEDLWQALALAGGPTSHSNLGTIKVLTRDTNAQSAVTVDLTQTLTRGNKTPYIIKPGDIVFVDAHGPSAWQAFSNILGVATDVANIVAVIRVLDTHP